MGGGTDRSFPSPLRGGWAERSGGPGGVAQNAIPHLYPTPRHHPRWTLGLLRDPPLKGEGKVLALLRRELSLAVRAGGGAPAGVLFFLAVVATVPLAVGPDPATLSRIGPAVLWIGALLASLLGLDRLFQADREDGALDLLIIASDRHFLPLTVFVKAFAHWIAGILPVVVAAPLFGLLLGMEALAIGATLLTLLVGTPAIAFVGSAGAAAAVALPRGGLLVSVLVLPIVLPVLIFGVSASYAATAEPDPFLPPFLILCALTLFLAVVGPVAAAVAVRWSGD